MEAKIFNVICKIVILILGILGIFLGFERIEISGVISNPPVNFYHNFYFGVIYFPSRIVGSGYRIWYNLIVYIIFIIIFITGFFLNFGYFNKQKMTRIRKNLDLISAVLMSIGLFGSLISPILTMLIIEIPPTIITSFSINLSFLSGFYMAIIVIILVLAEFIILEKTNFFKKIERTNKK
ncbi:MAG: hypothetical protein ACFFB0_13320 [Promethearchaeota archaeon]